MNSYRLIDELPDAKRRRAPWSPLGLFFLTWLYLPMAIPFWILNWGRLGHPERRLVALLAALGAFGLPFVMIMALQINAETTRLFSTLAKFAFAYFQLYAQRPLYESLLNRGGEKAPAWQLWLAAALAVGIQIATFRR